MPLPADAKTLLTSLKTVAENDSFQTFVDKALKLDTEIVELMGSKRVQDRQLQDAENKLKDAEERLKDREEQLSVSQATLKKKEEKINALQGQLRAQQKKNEDSLRSTKTALEIKSRKLSELERYSLELKPVVPDDV
jgi:septal ring factor EnvC (AmiA/AmiB activator)